MAGGLDVPFEIKTPGFWQEFRSRIKEINREAYIVGEVWTDSRQWLDGTKFDGVMNYLFTGPTIAFAAGDRVIMEYVERPDYYPYPALSAKEYGKKIQKLLSLYPWEIQLTQLNLLNSHDTARLLTIVDGDRSSIELATILLLTFLGAPSIYYGDEVGLSGGFDPDCRRSFPQEVDWENDVLAYHKKLISLRHQYPALRTGNYKIVFAEDMVYVFARILGEQEVVVAVNIDRVSAKVKCQVNELQSYPDKLLYGNGQASWIHEKESSYLELTLSPRTGCIFGVNTKKI